MGTSWKTLAQRGHVVDLIDELATGARLLRAHSMALSSLAVVPWDFISEA